MRCRYLYHCQAQCSRTCIIPWMHNHCENQSKRAILDILQIWYRTNQNVNQGTDTDDWGRIDIGVFWFVWIFYIVKTYLPINKARSRYLLFDVSHCQEDERTYSYLNWFEVLKHWMMWCGNEIYYVYNTAARHTYSKIIDLWGSLIRSPAKLS